MKLIISGRNIDVTEALKEKVSKKLGKLDKFFNPDVEAHVTMSVQKNNHIIEVTILSGGMIFRAEESSESMYTSIDKVIDILERQIRKNKTRLEKRLREGAFLPSNFKESEEVPEEHEYKIVRSKKYNVKPMDVEEAILQMNLIGHEFFVFLNADTRQTNVVYKRKDGNYGLIEPEF